MAVWALGCLADAAELTAFRQQFAHIEEDPEVCDEWRDAGSR
jgi:hypothetical protein